MLYNIWLYGAFFVFKGSENLKKWIIRILMIMSSVVFIISAIYIAKNLKENKIQEKEFENIANIV